MKIEINRNQGFTEQRRTKRSDVGIDCTVRERSRSAVPAAINNFSASGIGIKSKGSPLPGSHIWVKLDGLDSVTGRVVWTNDNIAGVEFERPLHPAVALRFEPGVRQDGPCYAEHDQVPGTVTQLDPLLSRREQIMQGVAGSDLSPLKRRKQPTGVGILGSISRTVSRSSDHRHELRFGDPAATGEMTLTIGTLPAMVEDVSSSGLRIRTELMVDIGTALTVEFDGFEPIIGKVIWLGNGTAGISLPPQSIDLHSS